MLIVFLSNSPATTEVYTYSHALSLPDALPCSSPSFCPSSRASRLKVRSPASVGHGLCSGFFFTYSAMCLPAARPNTMRSSSELEPSRLRSEEHTSELQSLMRTSYAVFCLQKTYKTC